MTIPSLFVPLLLTLQQAGAAVDTKRVLEPEPEGGNIFFPPQLSTVAREIDDVFYFILWVSIISFVVVIGVGTMFVLKYRERPGHRAEKTSTHDNTLEVTWTIIPTILVAIMFYVGFKGFIDLRSSPADSYQVEVTAQRWVWGFTYPNGHTSTDGALHLPPGRPVRLLMKSMDVLHSLYIPAFRVKQDVVPGRYATLWFESYTPEVETHLQLYCTEYCGTSHSDMLARVILHPSQESFDAWLADDSNIHGKFAPYKAGEILYASAGCTACHDLGDTTKIGPGFAIVSRLLAEGARREFTDGSGATVDENYLRESILQPQTKIVAGFQGKVMTPYAGRLSEEDLSALIAFLRSVHAGPPEGADALPPAPAEGEAAAQPAATEQH
ncbi:MAG TPA: cytochrome c oxidase subunit II [Planctomycetota bacterium]|nr:cytochrome c oxidase subunit II [Planctomycetota bacterium]